MAAPILPVESVHLAVRAGDAARAVTGGEESVGVVLEIPGRLEPDGLQRDLVAVRVVTVGRRRRAGKPVEQVVERAVLLHDDNDVLDFSARARAVHAPGGRQLHARRRRQIQRKRCARTESAVTAACRKQKNKTGDDERPTPVRITTHRVSLSSKVAVGDLRQSSHELPLRKNDVYHLFAANRIRTRVPPLARASIVMFAAIARMIRNPKPRPGEERRRARNAPPSQTSTASSPRASRRARSSM